MGKSKKENNKFEYRAQPTTLCPYLLETTPLPHYVGPAYKIVELILINRFGKKNIPVGLFWRQVDTTTEIYDAQKSLWPILQRLVKTYDYITIMNMVVSRKIKFLSGKMIARYLYWCKEEAEQMEKIKNAHVIKPVIVIQDSSGIEEYKVEKKEEKTLIDWLEE